MTLRTSSSVRNDDAFAQNPLQPESDVDWGAGGDVPALLIELLPPLQAVSPKVVASASQTSLVFRIAPSPQRESDRKRIATMTHHRNGMAAGGLSAPGRGRTKLRGTS